MSNNRDAYKGISIMKKIYSFSARWSSIWAVAVVLCFLVVPALHTAEAQQETLLGFPKDVLLNAGGAALRELTKEKSSEKLKAKPLVAEAAAAEPSKGLTQGEKLTALINAGGASSEALARLIYRIAVYTQRIVIDKSVQPGKYVVDVAYMPSKDVEFVVDCPEEGGYIELFEADGVTPLLDQDAITVVGREIRVKQHVWCIQSVTIMPFGQDDPRAPVTVTVPWSANRCWGHTFSWSEDRETGALRLTRGFQKPKKAPVPVED